MLIRSIGMPKDCDKVAPGSLTSEGSSQPAQELDGALSKAQGASSQKRERAIRFLAELDFPFDALGSSSKFNFGPNVAIFFKHVFKNEKELVSEANECGLHGFRCRAGCPGFEVDARPIIDIVMETAERIRHCGGGPALQRQGYGLWHTSTRCCRIAHHSKGRDHP